MKEKLSMMVDPLLVQFLDSLPGRSRSEKLEQVLRCFQEVSDKDKKVKKQAPQYYDLDALAGSWTKAEAAMFDKALAKQRTIDTVQSKRN